MPLPTQQAGVDKGCYTPTPTPLHSPTYTKHIKGDAETRPLSLPNSKGIWVLGLKLGGRSSTALAQRYPKDHPLPKGRFTLRSKIWA